MKRTILFFTVAILSLLPPVRTATLPWENENQSAARQAIIDYANGIADVEESIASDLEDQSFDAKKVDEAMKKRIAEIRGDAFKPVNAETDSLIDDQGKLGGSEAAELFRDRARGYRAAVGSGFDVGNVWIPWVLVIGLLLLVVYLAGVATYVYQHGDRKALAWMESFGEWARTQAKEVKHSSVVERVNAEWDAADADMAALEKKHAERMARIQQMNAEVKAATADPHVTLETTKAT